MQIVVVVSESSFVRMNSRNILKKIVLDFGQRTVM